MNTMDTFDPPKRYFFGNWGFWGEGFAILLGWIGMAVATRVALAAAAAPPWFLWALAGSWLVAMLGIWRWAQREAGSLPPLLALVSTLALAEGLIRGLRVPPGLIPAPSQVLVTCWTLRELLWRDVWQTFFLEALVGLLLGAMLAGLLGLVIGRFAWLQRGLMPYLAALSSIPIPAFAPVLITGLGLDWPSKAAVVTVVVLFPFVINFVKGTQEISPLLVDLLNGYSATSWQRFRYVRWPHALPYLFHALKIAITLASIAAIAAEFMGSPSYGLGFRIRSEAGRFQFDRVWAAIVYATVCSTASFWLVAAAERRWLFWDPARRGER